MFCGPQARGTFTIENLRRTFKQISQVKSINRVCFEGGEAFLYYPVLLEGVRLARGRGLAVGLVSNAFWATTVEDAKLWLQPLFEAGVSSLFVSDDAYHCGDLEHNSAKRALIAAHQMGLRADSISVGEPRIETKPDGMKGKAIVRGDVMFRGRAAENLIKGLPRQDCKEFNECPHEELKDPMRVHLDPYGNVHLCQGILMGNIWKIPLAELIVHHASTVHPICGPLVRGGPAELARELEFPISDGFVDACHLCYFARKDALWRFPDYLGPQQVYGLGG